jgi:hypothetical protein
VSAIYSFYLAMIMHPEIQRKAQAEIDRVIGNNRFPTSADQADLPYVGAIAKEVLRWGPVVPFGKSNFPEVVVWNLPSSRGLISKGLATRYSPRLCRGRLLRGIFYPQGIFDNSEHLVSFRKGERPCRSPPFPRTHSFLLSGLT